MIAREVADARPRGARARTVRWNHPEWWLAVLAGFAWIALVDAGPEVRRAGGIGSGWRPAAPVPIVVHTSAELLLWMLMTAAMMLPTILPMARHVGLVSYWDRRQRALVAYAGGYAAIWVIAGVGLIAAIHVLEQIAGPAISAVVAFGAAVAWQCSPRKRSALGSCGDAPSMSSSARGTVVSCLGLGADLGLRCVASCWALMSATLATGHSLVSMGVIGGVILWERRTGSPRPERSVPVIALLGVVTVLTSVAGARLP